jgi:predicted ribosome quality control (RQC) complex YloA/Tae2 family protein
MNFREFTTKTGKKIFLGKSAEQNEILMKQYMLKENIILHTEKPGSPFAVILDLNPLKEDIKEAATFCALKSKDWRDNEKDVIINVFSGKDVYKDKNMPTGTFGVKKSQKLRIKKEEILKLKDRIEILEKQKESFLNDKKQENKKENVLFKIKRIFNKLSTNRINKK